MDGLGWAIQGRRKGVGELLCLVRMHHQQLHFFKHACRRRDLFFLFNSQRNTMTMEEKKKKERKG